MIETKLYVKIGIPSPNPLTIIVVNEYFINISFQDNLVSSKRNFQALNIFIIQLVIIRNTKVLAYLGSPEHSYDSTFYILPLGITDYNSHQSIILQNFLYFRQDQFYL